MPTKNSSVLKKIILSLAIGWTFLILLLCLVKFSDLPALKVSGADKFGHFSFHFGFTLLWGYYSWLKQGKIQIKSLVKVIMASLCYGILIEFLQAAFTTTRQADVMDVVANLTGAMVAFLVFLSFKHIKKR
ncbi:MAG: VanZ family protein [Flavobacterium sp.]|nr:VanZ family protein [Flavobacterium sp.]MBP8157450.1 VanZ family protein [Flavobacterium sp.]